MKNRVTILLCGLGFAAACSEEPPPRSVDYFARNPIVLEAVVVRCNENRYETRYDVECINAREAARRISPKEEAERRDALEAQSQVKREALRATQEAIAEQQRRAADAEKERAEAEYLAQFGELPPQQEEGGVEQGGNLPVAIIPEPEDDIGATRNSVFDEEMSRPPSDGGNAPVVEIEPADDPAEADNE